MILCNCGKPFADLSAATDHLTVASLFGLADKHGIKWQDGNLKLTPEGLHLILMNNFNFIEQNMKGGMPCGTKGTDIQPDSSLQRGEQGSQQMSFSFPKRTTSQGSKE